MNKENDWDHVTVVSMVEELIKNVTFKEMVIAIKVMKPGKAAGHPEVFAGMISASEEVGFSVMVELCWYQFSRKREILEVAIHT